MRKVYTANIAIDEESFDLTETLICRRCDNDIHYPYALEGITKGGHEVSISLTKADVLSILQTI